MPQFNSLDDDGNLTGFGYDFAQAINSICPSTVRIEVVRELWPNCWTDDDGGGIGKAITDNIIDGCIAYVHTNVRDAKADITGAILDDNKAAGLLTLLDAEGNPRVSGRDDLAGRTLIDVAGWAPSPDGLKFVTNQCTGSKYSDDIGEVLIAEVDEENANPNDVAMRMLRDGEGDAIFIMADQASNYIACDEEAGHDCELWAGLGTDYAYVQTGQFGYVRNGTTFALTEIGSGIPDLLEPCMAEFMGGIEYYELCAKYDIIDRCYANDYFDEDRRSEAPFDKPTSEQFGDCSDGYCPCDSIAADDVLSDEGGSGGGGDEGFPVVAAVGIAFGAAIIVVVAMATVSMARKRRRVQEEKEQVRNQAKELKQRVLASGMAAAADGTVSVSTGGRSR